MLIIRNQIQHAIFAQQAAPIAFRYPPPDIWYLDLQKTYQKPKTLISFRMPIISQSLTMPPPPPFVPLSPKQPQKNASSIPRIYLAPLLPGPHACWPWGGSEAICMIYPNNIGSH